MHLSFRELTLYALGELCTSILQHVLGPETGASLCNVFSEYAVTQKCDLRPSHTSASRCARLWNNSRSCLDYVGSSPSVPKFQNYESAHNPDCLQCPSTSCDVVPPPYLIRCPAQTLEPFDAKSEIPQVRRTIDEYMHGREGRIQGLLPDSHQHIC